MKRLTKKKLFSLVFSLILAALYLTSSSTSTNHSNSPVSPTRSVVLGAKEGAYYVTKVSDGDTIIVTKDTKEEKVRLLGINTPETVDPRRPVECFGKEASAKVKELLLGKEVTLVADETQSDRDRYDRLLRYVYLVDGTFINELLLREGYAYEYTYDVPYIHQQRFKALEQEAKTAEKGLWNQSICP